MTQSFHEYITLYCFNIANKQDTPIAAMWMRVTQVSTNYGRFYRKIIIYSTNHIYSDILNVQMCLNETHFLCDRYIQFILYNRISLRKKQSVFVPLLCKSRREALWQPGLGSIPFNQFQFRSNSFSFNSNSFFAIIFSNSNSFQNRSIPIPARAPIPHNDKSQQ